MRTTLLLAGLALLAGCWVEREPTVTAPPPTSTTAPSPTSAPTTAPATSTTMTGDGCPEGDVMLADGGILAFDRPSSDGARIAGITWRTTGACHLVTISFATEDGAPATTPPSLSARILRDAGVLRIETEATASVVVDQLVEEGSVERLFVPVDADGRRFVDLVLSQPTVARAQILTSPARLEIELQPGGPEVGRPLITSQVVVVEPGSAAQAEPVLDIVGYSTGEVESLDVAVMDGEESVIETQIELEPTPEQWTAFQLVLPMGEESYDTLRVTTDDGAVVAAIPFSP